jgi:hypothetical protein
MAAWCSTAVQLERGAAVFKEALEINATATKPDNAYYLVTARTARFRCASIAAPLQANSLYF